MTNWPTIYIYRSLTTPEEFTPRSILGTHHPSPRRHQPHRIEEKKKEQESGKIHDLARVHDPLRIEGVLDLAHDGESIRADLEEQGLLLAPADGVLAGAGPFHVEGAPHHVLDALLDLVALRRVRPVVHDALVEVAVAHVAQDAGEQAQVVHLLLRYLDDVREPAERHRYVRAPWLRVLV